ncbi:hypothetical protein GOODEAATRI_022876 [Goodea atripinnis]|uniref:TM2 domain-containing protein n=1 Tax=Goodea atripinnis TaxID=208336 RepID=A0ABV0NMJ7_9TELE
MRIDSNSFYPQNRSGFILNKSVRFWRRVYVGSFGSDAFTLPTYLCKDPKIDEATQEPENCREGEAPVDCFPAPNVTCRLSNGTELRFSGEEVGFNRTIACRNVSGYSYKVAVALSLFLGWLGADRFYLGYPALGLLKFCTVGFCGIGTLIDFILIAMQVSPNLLRCKHTNQSGADRKEDGEKEPGSEGKGHHQRMDGQADRLQHFMVLNLFLLQLSCGEVKEPVLYLLQIVGPADGSNYIVDYYGARLTRLSITNETYRKPHLSL